MTDIYDYHDYNQDAEGFRGALETMLSGEFAYDTFPKRLSYPYKSGAMFCSEYGGIKWDEEAVDGAWGYGEAPKTKEEFIERYRGLTEALLENEHVMGFCYTQLYDVEQECNGLYYYDRRPKFNNEIMKKFSEVMNQKAAIEE